MTTGTGNPRGQSHHRGSPCSACGWRPSPRLLLLRWPNLPRHTRHHNSFTHHTEELWAQENISKAALALPSRASAALASTTLPGGSVSFGRSPTLQRGRTCPSPPGVHSWKRRSTSSAIMAAMAREEVAAGEGAFLTCRILLPTLPVPPSNTKSSTKFPSLSRA